LPAARAIALDFAHLHGRPSSVVRRLGRDIIVTRASPRRQPHRDHEKPV